MRKLEICVVALKIQIKFSYTNKWIYTCFFIMRFYILRFFIIRIFIPRVCNATNRSVKVIFD